MAKAEILRLIYQGRFLHSNVTLGALGLPFGKTTVMHLVPRENLPEPNSQGKPSPDPPAPPLLTSRPLLLSRHPAQRRVHARAARRSRLSRPPDSPLPTSACKTIQCNKTTLQKLALAFLSYRRALLPRPPLPPRRGRSQRRAPPFFRAQRAAPGFRRLIGAEGRGWTRGGREGAASPRACARPSRFLRKCVV